jgi:hypothetical protein
VLNRRCWRATLLRPTAIEGDPPSHSEERDRRAGASVGRRGHIARTLTTELQAELGRNKPVATIERYQNASGATLYMVRYRQPNNVQTKRRGFATKHAAEAFAASVEVKKITGSYVAPSLGRVTVGELGPAWLDRKCQHTAPSHYRTLETRGGSTYARRGERSRSPTWTRWRWRRGLPP